MTSLARTRRIARSPVASLRRAAGRMSTRRRLPWGVVARERRMLAAALHDAPGRVLVIGPTTALRQALQAREVDVVGTSPHDAQVNVVSDLRAGGALPRGRYDWVVLTSADAGGQNGLLPSAAAACRPGGHLVVLTSAVADLAGLAALAGTVGIAVEVRSSRSRALVVARTHP